MPRIFETIEVVTDGDFAHVRISAARIDTSELEDAFQRDLFALIDEQRTSRIVINCCLVQFLGSSALSTLVELSAKIAVLEKPGKLVFYHLLPAIREHLSFLQPFTPFVIAEEGQDPCVLCAAA